MTRLILLFVTVAMVLVNARHLHPHVDAEEPDFWENNFEEEKESDPLTEDNVNVESISNIKPSRFVPINNKIFFMGYLPCEDGFKRDIMGICREVWD